MTSERQHVVDASEPLANSATPAPEAPGVHAPRRLWLHVLLFVLTFMSATWSQSLSGAADATLAEVLASPLHDAARLLGGFTFALTLMAILLAHEMGHYLTARRYGVDQSLPYFIPAPTFFGTLGAVIVMRSRPPNRSVLLRVALAGPVAGLTLAVPAAIWGLGHSPAVDPSILRVGDGWLGSSLLFAGLEHLFAPAGGVYTYHPVALAAWVGCLVTAINLMPAAQLDGGHIAYALFGQGQRWLSRGVVAILFVLGLYLGPREDGLVWLIWAVLLTMLGLSHPSVRDEQTALSTGERLWAYAGLVLFVVTFMPVPATHLRADQLETLRRDIRSDSGEPGLRRPVAPSDDAPRRSPPSDAPPAEEFRL